MRPHVPPNRDHHTYRPDLCLKFRRGNCNHGADCRFVHSVGDFFRRPEPPPRFGNPSTSSVSKPKLCWKYANGGDCRYGERCIFLHDHSRKSVATRVMYRGGGGGGGGRSGGDCKSEVEGGLNAKEAVVVAVKTRLCNNWEANGSCPYGHNCKFAHGEAELMRSDENDKALAHVTTPMKQRVFKWIDVEKISRIYADWIEIT